MSAPFRFSEAAFIGGVISPELWGRVDLDKWRYGLKSASNMFVHKTGGISSRPGTKFVGEYRVDASTSLEGKLLPFEYSADQSYLLVCGINGTTPLLRVVKDHALVVDATPVSITAASQANPCDLTSVGHGLLSTDRVYISGVAGMTELNGRTFDITVLSADVFTLQSLFGDNIDSSAYGAYTSGGTAAKIYETSSVAWDFVSTVSPLDLRWAQSPDRLYVTHQLDVPQKITRTADDNWTVASVTFTPVQAAPGGVGAVATVASGTVINRYVVAAVSATTGEESLPSGVVTATNDLTVAGNYNTISWSAASGAGLYIVYKYDGVYGYIGSTTALSFIDDNIVPDVGDTVQTANNPFSGAGDYPALCAFHEQRLTFANTVNNPNAVWMSQSGLFENMNVSKPTKDDDAVSFKLVSNSRNDVRGLLSLGELLAFTGKTAFAISGGSNTGYITPSSILPKPQSSLGAREIPPLDVGESALYVQKQGGTIIELRQNENNSRYGGIDLAAFVPHLFKGRYVVDWCYSEMPYNLVAVVLDDGSFLTMTYLPEQNVLAWTGPHWIGGSNGDDPAQVVSATCIEGANEDEIYFVVRRVIDGDIKLYIEYLVPRVADVIEDAYFVDCGLSYTGSSRTVFRNLDHLRGETVVALADGNVVTGLTVSNDGVVTLPNAATDVHIGLPYEAAVELLPIETDLKSSGSTAGRAKNITGIVLKLENSRGFHYGPSEDQLIPFQQRDAENWNDPIAPFTGNTKVLKVPSVWKNQTTMVIKQTNPLPLTVLAAYPDVVMGGA